MVSKKYNNVLAGLLIFCMLGVNLPVFAQEVTTSTPTENAVQTEQPNEEMLPTKVYKGEIEIDAVQENEFLTGEKQEIKQGTQLELTVSTVLGSDVTMEGDEFFAEVTNDLSVGGNIVVPIGSVAHGRVTESQGERRLGRDGFVKIEFDYLLTPDGREVPINAKLSTKSHPMKSFAKVALTDMGYTLVGGALGGLLALKVGGLGLAVASHGYSIAGGAAVGGTIGLTQSLVRKGKPLLITPGDQIKVKFTSDHALPVMKKSALADEELALEGLTVNIIDCKFEKDPFGTMNTITLNINILNQSEETFTFFDVALVNEYGGIYYPSPFNDTDMWFQKIKPGSKLQGNMSFSVDNPRQSHWLVFYDKYTRKELAKISVTNALRDLNASKDAKKKKKKS